MGGFGGGCSTQLQQCPFAVRVCVSSLRAAHKS